MKSHNLTGATRKVWGLSKPRNAAAAGAAGFFGFLWLFVMAWPGACRATDPLGHSSQNLHGWFLPAAITAVIFYFILAARKFRPFLTGC
jgi:hypothetical protein